MRSAVRRGVILVAGVLALVALPSIALGYSDPSYATTDCNQCHSSDSTASGDWNGSGPHGGYTASTRKCSVCHSIHEAPAGGIILLAEATITDTCLSCHDGTGGSAPYDAITARGGVVAGEHSMGTSVVPGGSSNLDENLSCGDCHSVHGINVVGVFARDSGVAMNATNSTTFSNSLLRNDVGDVATGAYPVYGAQWCASCHDQRHSDSTVINHPVNTSYTFGYGEVTISPGAAPDYEADANLFRWVYDPNDASADYMLGMGQTNGSYVMGPADGDPAGIEAARVPDGVVENRQDPICQQCHEDARDVEAYFGLEAYVGGVYYGTNPEFLTFPHQTTNTNMLVETGDDLCLNCHPVASLN